MIRLKFILFISAVLFSEGFCTTIHTIKGYELALDSMYKVLREENLIPEENRYGVIGLSTFSIEDAVLTLMKADPLFLDQDNRPWEKEAMEVLSRSSDGTNKLQIMNVGYDAQTPIDPTIPLLVDATWISTTTSFKPVPALVYTYSSTYLTLARAKISVAFFTDREFAQKVQKHLTYTGSGVRMEDLIFVEKYFKNKKLFEERRNFIIKQGNAAYETLTKQVSQFNSQKKGNLILTRIPSNLRANVEGTKEEIAEFRSLYYSQKREKPPAFGTMFIYSVPQTETRLSFKLWSYNGIKPKAPTVSPKEVNDRVPGI